ncbi:hypothetical protein Tco_1434247 [Tanacetum coccineum]
MSDTEASPEPSNVMFALKLPKLKTREYQLWSMRMQQYLTYNDFALWEVILNGNSPTTAAASSASGEVAPKTAAQLLARRNEEKAKNILLLGIPDEHLLIKRQSITLW